MSEQAEPKRTTSWRLHRRAQLIARIRRDRRRAALLLAARVRLIHLGRRWAR